LNLNHIDVVFEEAREICEIRGLFRASKQVAKPVVKRVRRSREIASSSFVRPEGKGHALSLSKMPTQPKSVVKPGSIKGKSNADLWDQVYGKKAIADSIQALDTLMEELVWDAYH
jgi:hypothetical protein